MRRVLRRGRRALAARHGVDPIHLLLGGGAALAALIVIGTAFFLVEQRARALMDSQRELQNLALVLAEQTDRAFQALAVVQSSIVDRMEEREVISPEAFQRQMSLHNVHLMLRDKISGLPHVDAVTLIDRDGNLVNFSRYWPIPAVNVADRDYFKALKADPARQWFVSEPVPNRGTGTWTIYLARKFTGPQGQFLGLVLGAMELQYFEDFFKAIALGPDSAVAIFRSDGILLARYPRVAPVIGRSYAGRGIFDAPAGHEVTIRPSIIDGRERIIAQHTLPHYPVVVVVSTTAAAALAEWRDGAWYAVAVASLLVLALAAAVLLLVHQMRGRDLLAVARAEAMEAERARAVAEAELLRGERLSVLGQLTATVAHELRNPLGVIRNTVFLLKETMAAKGVVLDRPIDRIERSVVRCDDIISDLLDHTKTRELRREAVRVDTWIGELLDEQKLPEGVVLERRLGAGDALASIDGERFRRVVINLVENAAHALAERPPGAERRIAVGTRCGDALEITVADTGAGIAPEILPRIFEPLFSTKSFGTGLGLSTVKQIVEQHGGSISVASEVGRGTTIRIVLPMLVAGRTAA